MSGSAQGDSRFRLRFKGGSYKSVADGRVHKIDAVVTLTGWDYLVPNCPECNKHVWKCDGNDDGHEWEFPELSSYEVFQPGIYVNESYDRRGGLYRNFNFYTVGLASLDVSVQYYYADTSVLAPVKGHMTCIDLDVAQSFGFGGSVVKAEVAKGNGFLRAEGTVVTSADEARGPVSDEHGAINGPGDPAYRYGLVGAYFNKDDGVWENDDGSVVTVDPDDPVKLMFGSSWKGLGSTCQSFFAMTDEFLTLAPPDDPNVGSLGVEKTADRTEGVSVGDEVAYSVDTPVHTRGVDCRYGYSYTDFEIVDVLPAEMRYVEGSGYLADAAGNRIEGAGEVVYEGDGDAGRAENTVKFEFSRDYLQNRMAMQGEHYVFHFKAVLTEYPADGALSVTNSSHALINATGRYPSNSVTTELVTPVLSVDKRADRYECEVGDVVTFTATFSQTARSAQARETVISDNLAVSK